MGESKTPPKLPLQQVLILATCRLAEPLCYTSVFPYLPEMIESFNVPKDEVARWAGISSAVFSISQAVAGVFWGRASDRWGRKAIILFGLFFSLLTCLMFGFSTSLASMVVSRMLAGLISGDVGIIRTAVAELVPQKELQPRAFSVMPVTFTVGTIFGPAIGGVLANPAQSYPDTLGRVPFLRTYPFALPNLVIGIFFIISMVVGFLFLNETLEERKYEKDRGRMTGRYLVRTVLQVFGISKLKKSEDETTPLLKNEPDAPASRNFGSMGHCDIKPRPQVTYREVFSHQSMISLTAFALLCLHSLTFTQLLAILMHLPQQENRASNPDVQLPFKFGGGFGLESQRIGLMFTLCGIVIIFLQIFIFPIMARRLGILSCFKLSSVIHPFCYIATPFTVLLPNSVSQQIAMFLILLLRGCGVVLAFPCNSIMLINSAASPHLLGVLNGFGTTASALGSAIGPAIGGYTFTLGIRIGYGILPWWTLTFFAILGAVPIWCLEDTQEVAEERDPDPAVNDPVVVAPSPFVIQEAALGGLEGAKTDESTEENVGSVDTSDGEVGRS